MKPQLPRSRVRALADDAFVDCSCSGMDGPADTLNGGLHAEPFPGSKLVPPPWLRRRRALGVNLAVCFALKSYASFAQPGQTEAMVSSVVHARWEARQTLPVTRTFGPLNLDQAYAVQRVLDAKVRTVLGQPVGYKVAYASKAAQEQFGVKEPARGTLFALQQVPNGSTLRAVEFREILLERNNL